MMNYQLIESLMMELELDRLEKLLIKPKFSICFRYSNYPFVRPDKPYLVPLNETARKFRKEFYGRYGILFNRDCV